MRSFLRPINSAHRRHLNRLYFKGEFSSSYSWASARLRSPESTIWCTHKAGLFSVCDAPAAKSVGFDGICQAHQNSLSHHMSCCLCASRQYTWGWTCTKKRGRSKTCWRILASRRRRGYLVRSLATLKGLSIVLVFLVGVYSCFFFLQNALYPIFVLIWAKRSVPPNGAQSTRCCLSHVGGQSIPASVYYDSRLKRIKKNKRVFIRGWTQSREQIHRL